MTGLLGLERNRVNLFWKWERIVGLFLSMLEFNWTKLRRVRSCAVKLDVATGFAIGRSGGKDSKIVSKSSNQGI